MCCHGVHWCACVCVWLAGWLTWCHVLLSLAMWPGVVHGCMAGWLAVCMGVWLAVCIWVCGWLPLWLSQKPRRFSPANSRHFSTHFRPQNRRKKKSAGFSGGFQADLGTAKTKTQKPKTRIKSVKPKSSKPQTQKLPKPAPNPQNPSRQNPKPASNLQNPNRQNPKPKNRQNPQNFLGASKNARTNIIIQVGGSPPPRGQN